MILVKKMNSDSLLFKQKGVQHRRAARYGRNIGKQGKHNSKNVMP